MCNKISPLYFIAIELVQFFLFPMEMVPIRRKISSSNVWRIHIICLGRPNWAALHHYIPVYRRAGGIIATGSSIHITCSHEIISTVICRKLLIESTPFRFPFNPTIFSKFYTWPNVRLGITNPGPTWTKLIYSHVCLTSTSGFPRASFRRKTSSHPHWTKILYCVGLPTGPICMTSTLCTAKHPICPDHPTKYYLYPYYG